ncbi:MAG: hypothetical protein AAEJ46_00195 [Planctomycetota bacterium]
MIDATVLETGSRVISTRGNWARPGLALLMVMILVGYSGGVAPLAAQDDPGIARLEMKFERPRQITVFGGKGNDLRPDGVPGSGRTYWYLPYTIENKSGIDSTFHLGMKASSDKNRRYADIALPWVEKAVERRERKLLFSRVDMLKKNGAGELGIDFAAGDKRECVAIFNAIDPEADRIVIDVHGLIDDIEVEELPDNGVRLTERVLRLEFHRPGDEFFTSMDSFQFEKKSWVFVTHEFPGS